jgi:hypothetical protein
MRKIKPNNHIPSLVATLLLFNQGAGLCNEKPNQPAGTRITNTPAKPAASAQDILIVELSDKADRSEFDDLLQEVHGKVIKTLDFGPKLKMLVIQTEPGKSTEVEKRLSKDKDIIQIQHNQTYHINEVENVSPNN